jgi:hypothetical protein
MDTQFASEYLNGKDLLEYLRHNIKMDLKEINCEVMDLSHQTLDRDRWRPFINK